MKYLADANVLSEITRPAPAPKVVEWLRGKESELVVTPVILGEIEFGILLLPQGRRRRRRLEEWFAEGKSRLRVLEFTADTASHWAHLLARLRRNGRSMPVKDSLIAASALEHGLTVATRNTSDFRYSGVGIFNPFE